MPDRFGDQLAAAAERFMSDMDELENRRPAESWFRLRDAIKAYRSAPSTDLPICDRCGVEYIEDYEGPCGEPRCNGSVSYKATVRALHV